MDHQVSYNNSDEYPNKGVSEINGFYTDKKQLVIKIPYYQDVI